MSRRRLLVLALLAGCATLRGGGADLPIRVMSYNIQYGGANLDGIADAIRAQSPDVVALQEVDVHWSDRSQWADQATELGARLGMQVRFARIYQLPAPEGSLRSREFGVALLSRLPILRWQNDSLTRLSTQEANPVAARMPGLLEATIEVRGQQIRIFNTHLDYRADPAVRVKQVAEMVSHVGASSQPTIVFGDFNATPDAPELAPLLAALRDTWSATAGPGLTYPAMAPVKRIDYVLVSSHFQVRAASVPATGPSDHRPMVVDLLLSQR